MNARGYPCAKGYNSSASQWLSGEQVRLCPGHPKVHFGTILEGSWGESGRGGGCTVCPPGSLTKCFVRTGIWHPALAIPRWGVVQPFFVVCKKRRSSVPAFFVVVCSFQISSENDIRHMTEGDFHFSCCAMSFSQHLFSWEKSWMFCENCACTWDLWVSYCVAQSCRVSYCVAQSCRVRVACSSCIVIFFVFFFMIMIREYRACSILHSAWRWAHIFKTSMN